MCFIASGDFRNVGGIYIPDKLSMCQKSVYNGGCWEHLRTIRMRVCNACECRCLGEAWWPLISNKWF
ncbi:hypothetical protein Naga_103686g1 [Nannochloropsis gaditana]|uniref:Uncharacterized protein n=1 Tax=Nannochloropsis gaditana TaxID=72520 RepID=W7T9T2_9STRA|nr:hypothetical protein Naga_103686g1 [Nannochloropsis gaditana]